MLWEFFKKYYWLESSREPCKFCLCVNKKVVLQSFICELPGGRFGTWKFPLTCHHYMCNIRTLKLLFHFISMIIIFLMKELLKYSLCLESNHSDMMHGYH